MKEVGFYDQWTIQISRPGEIEQITFNSRQEADKYLRDVDGETKHAAMISLQGPNAAPEILCAPGFKRVELTYLPRHAGAQAALTAAE